ncbi:MAG: SOS response-associated peptidase [Candidatus Zixiibacteriota bacterium]
MCGRYTLASAIKAWEERFQLNFGDHLTAPRFNVTPGQSAPVIVQGNRREVRSMRWRLVPHWSKDETIGNKMINARSETLAEKPSFRRPLERTRCLVPADGFYEWRLKPSGKGKVPVRFVLKNGEPFAFAGLFDQWMGPDDLVLESFTIITTSPNELAAKVHNRMPVILPRDSENLWLTREAADLTGLTTLLRPYPAEQMDFYEVSSVVNSPANDTKACIAKVQTIL